MKEYCDGWLLKFAVHDGILEMRIKVYGMKERVKTHVMVIRITGFKEIPESDAYLKNFTSALPYGGSIHSIDVAADALHIWGAEDEESFTFCGDRVDVSWEEFHNSREHSICGNEGSEERVDPARTL